MTSHELDSFQTNLLADLRQHVATRAEGATAPVIHLDAGPSARRGRGRKVAWFGGLAAACTAAAVAVPMMSAQPAYAVSTEPGGVVHVHINRLEDASTLQTDLEHQGIRADVRYLPADMQCAPGRFTPAPSAVDSRTVYTVGGSGIDVKIDRRDLPSGGTVVISASRSAQHDGVNAQVGIAKGKVAPCAVTPAPKETSSDEG